MTRYSSHRLSRVWQVGVLAGVLGLGAACGGPASSDDDAIKIGVVQPFSGALAGYGEETQAGFDYVIERYNKAGGVESMDGAKIEMIKADDASEPSNTATEARRLMGKEGVSLVVGIPVTTEMAAISPVADQFQIPVLSVGAGGSNSEYVYSLGLPYDDGYAKSMADFLIDARDKKGAKLETVALVYTDYETGQEVSKGLEKRLKAAGFKIVADVPLPAESDNYKPQLARINSMDPDVAVGLVTTPSGVALHQARAATKSEVLFVGGTGGYADHQVWDSLGDSVAKDILVNNMFGLTNFAEAAKSPSLQKFLTEARKHEDELDAPLGQLFIAGAQMAYVVIDLLEKAGSSDPKDILDAFKDVDIPAGSDGVLFPRSDGLRFDPKTRFLTDNASLIVKWNEDETLDVMWPDALASEKLEANMLD